ncbi:predicted protein [Botrytis cinerea T4]|uniref:Uncharacterized protein n=1 Tax=Botryotinia fuckeliana (strain T4) TaxID=999810 RepID=G2YRW0_BOTF4|nr:predicted protein [Botrytis cinerea T4]
MCILDQAVIKKLRRKPTVAQSLSRNLTVQQPRRHSL